MGWPGETLLIRLWVTIENSGTGLLRPWQLKRVGKAEAEVATSRLVVIASAERQIAALGMSWPADIPLLPSSVDSSTNSVNAQIEPTWDLNLLTQNAASSQAIECLRKEVNIEKAVSHAESALEQDNAEPPTRTIDTDWFFRWREYAGGMSSDSLQQLWGHVLAGEVKAPGTFAYRTLDFLRSLDQVEAKLIERLAAVTIESCMVFHGKDLLNLEKSKTIANCLSYGELVLLEDLGVLNGVSASGYIANSEPSHTPDGRHVHLLACNGRGLLMTTDDPKKVIGLTFYRLTKLGLNVLQLVHATPDEAYLLSMGQLLADNGFKVEIGDVIKKDDATRTFKGGISVVSSP